jgi:hypothetical protein
MGMRHQDARDRDRAYEVEWIDGLRVGERRPGHTDQLIDRDRLGVLGQGRERMQQSDAIGFRLA